MKKTQSSEPALLATPSQLQAFSEDVSYLWCCSKTVVPVLEHPPTSLEFCRDFVHKSRPCIIRNAILDSTNNQNPLILTLDELVEKEILNPSLVLTVDVTPDGQGDCVRTARGTGIKHSSSTTTTTCEKDDSSHPNIPQHFNKGEIVVEKEVFVQPMEVPMQVQEFCQRLRRQRPKEHGYNPDAIDIHGRSVVSLLPSTMNVEQDEETSTSDQRSIRERIIPEDSIVYYSRQVCTNMFRYARAKCLHCNFFESYRRILLQNDCLRTELGNKLPDLFPKGMDWAQEAFGTSLEAINLWIGNEFAISSMHKDPYENLFYVASGEKLFTVCPPSDAPFLYEQQRYPRAVFETTPTACSSKSDEDIRWGISQQLEQHDDNDPSKTSVQWIAPDLSSLVPSSPKAKEHTETLLSRYPLLKFAHPMEIRVRAGELLYLPSLWYHRVTQSCETIGVNYWYDMMFDAPSWCYYSFLQQLKVVQDDRDNDSDVD